MIIRHTRRRAVAASIALVVVALSSLAWALIALTQRGEVIDAVGQRMAYAAIGFALVAAALALGMALLVVRRAARPLRELRQLASRLASGDLDATVPIPPDEDMAALSQDINLMASRLRQLIHTAEAERGRLSTVLATMGDGLLIVEPDDTVSAANPAAVAALGLPPAPFPLAAISIGPILSAALRRPPPAGVPGPVILDELQPQERGRSLRALVTRPAEGDTRQAIVILQDLSELRRAERARRALLANISHDLRTPLASLQVMLDALQDGALDERGVAEDFVRRMDVEVQGLSRLVNEFLSLSRIESGQEELHLVPTDPVGLLESAAARMAAQAAQRAIALRTELPPSLPAISVDPGRIEQVLLNLLQNALAFTPAGGSVTVRAAQDGPWLRVAIADTGVGIAPEHLPHIFERFYKSDPARSGGGTGLGLAIARHLVERHGGEILAASALGAGTTMTISLPLAPAEPR
ncbi:HAMP domain-containing protein [Oscillochloris sp. ZM17-4]|uniref:sensor histidine kinase n=1 Tax=Oscillochloris sp. ZM17-4 TaxID=2866714 RepID=UPI001C7338F8|nr:ATP-binding protein [Oscillochloris sp. ZM17-4]MBX0327723.1 HAMP domain-containing protein [Oscillochloris sp. ZM17-4]